MFVQHFECEAGHECTLEEKVNKLIQRSNLLIKTQGCDISGLEMARLKITDNVTLKTEKEFMTRQTEESFKIRRRSKTREE